MSSPSSAVWGLAGLLLMIVALRLAFLTGFEAGERSRALVRPTPPSCDLTISHLSPREAVCDAIIDQVDDLRLRERAASDAAMVRDTARD